MNIEQTHLLAIQQERRRLNNNYAFLNGEGELDADISNKIRPARFAGRFDPQDTSRKTLRLIESFANELHREMWGVRNGLLSAMDADDPLKLLNPAVAARHIDVVFEISPGLGSFAVGAERFETAGSIDRLNGKICVSRQMLPAVQRFTGAHELGHWVLHTEVVMHRDRPIEGPSRLLKQDPTERQADHFAAHFLMPRKIVTALFKARFGVTRFEFNDATAFDLGASKFRAANARRDDSLALAKLLASTEHYGGDRFESLADQLCVSVSAMARQLRDLGIVD